ncbi:hypothetical protein OG819_55345 [Streptomyces sp. NBC_01549]|uniref:hypothetical protein n=1 Tax=Streptomyces sp. NBC_01549 TaxID=2975874 RepID=UPI00224F69A8|nr:hypothetical protein [Streptomyces sp. NBC_01549]MCX4598334.1 hypothetical protein [Streptomyces sp. NBC_01549]
MNTLLYVLSTMTLGVVVLGIPAGWAFLAHARTEYDHGPGCWWCHPHLPHRRNTR